jgi:TPR repeat protein
MQGKINQLYVFMITVLAFVIVSYGERRPNPRELESAKAIYENGDYAAAFKAFNKLAEKGDAEAQFNLADMFYGGDGVQRDYARAATWYKRAAEQGHLDAQFNMACLYLRGEGVSQSFVDAAKWYLRAAEQGDAEAQVNVAVMYFKGEGVKEDRVQAYRWLIIAAGQGFRQAEQYGEIFASKLTPEQRAEGQKLSRGWKPRIKMKR